GMLVLVDVLAGVAASATAVVVAKAVTVAVAVMPVAMAFVALVAAVSAVPGGTLAGSSVPVAVAVAGKGRTGRRDQQGRGCERCKESGPTHGAYSLLGPCRTTARLPLPDCVTVAWFPLPAWASSAALQ